MPDSTLNALTAAIRAMQEVVVPEVNPDHPLAREQARLVSGFLGLLAARVEHLHAKERFDLRFASRQARALLEPAQLLSPAIAQELERLGPPSEDALSDPAATPSQLRALTQRITAVTTALVRTAAEADPAVRARVEGIVLDRSKVWLDVQRAWFAPQGWEPDPGAVPPLEEALAR